MTVVEGGILHSAGLLHLSACFHSGARFFGPLPLAGGCVVIARAFFASARSGIGVPRTTVRHSLLASAALVPIWTAVQTVGEIHPMRLSTTELAAGMGQVIVLSARTTAPKYVGPVDPVVLGTMGDGYLATGAHGQTLALGDRRADASHQSVDVIEQATILAGIGASPTDDGRYVGIDPGLGCGRKELVDGERRGLGLLGSSVVALEGDVSVIDDEEEALMDTIVEVEGVVGDGARAVSMVGEGA